MTSKNKKNNQKYILVSAIIFSAIMTLALSFLPADAADSQNANIKNRVANKQISNVIEPLNFSCDMTYPDKIDYSGEFLSVDVPSLVQPNQIFEITAQIKNTGNIPWLSSRTNCQGQSMTFLGTDKLQDRLSELFPRTYITDSRWYSGNRIVMDTLRVEPGEVATFKFTAQAPNKNGLYREFFSPVIEGKSWIRDKASFHFDLQVGELPENSEEILKYSNRIQSSMNLLNPSFEGGEKRILISISKQTMEVYWGDALISTFPVSTGTVKTPTPLGTMKIQFKQDVRVAQSYPHYIMPQFMQFKAGGYGIHALPSLANDKGVFWREALDHIGTRRSHGCVRLLPKDSDFLYNFAEVGTEVKVVW